jgi:hypothetical protein
LDELTGLGLTYIHWQDDVREAESLHVDWPNLFDNFLERIRKKQQLHVDDRSHPQVRALDSLSGSRLTNNVSQEDQHSSNRHDKLNQAAEALDFVKECVVCWVSKKAYVFVPCGHMCVCQVCAASIQMINLKCPLCQSASERIMKVFF